MLNFIRRYLALSNDSPKKIVFIAFALSLVCSLLVSTAAVILKPKQEENKRLEKRKNILTVAGLMKDNADIDRLFRQVETKVLDLTSGNYLSDDQATLMQKRLAEKDPGLLIKIPADQDIAQIKRRTNYVPIYLIKRDDEIDTLILPVHGYGLWSTLYGFIALQNDGKTIKGLSFYQHAETPGLGGEVDNPKWRHQWQGKLAFDEQGQQRIEVVRGKVKANSPDAIYQIDGLSGATLTSRGVNNLVKYWLSDQGYGTYLKKIWARQTNQ